MRLCRFQCPGQSARIGLATDDERLLDLTPAGVDSLAGLLEREAAELAGRLAEWTRPGRLPVLEPASVRLLCPIETQEVWAAGVTYLRSKQARMDESEFSATAYDRVYEAARPELFFKSLPGKAVGPLDPIGVRTDSTWSVPEPELALVLNSRGAVVGYTIGNDVSARDIEGDNLLYLPQAKIYDGSCALGPWIRVGVDEATARTWTVSLTIERAEQAVVRGTTRIERIRRGFEELAGWLFEAQRFPGGAVLLTGTGIVPPDDFTLEAGDRVWIEISSLGALVNPVVRVGRRGSERPGTC